MKSGEDSLDIDDVIAGRTVLTRLHGRIVVPRTRAAAALEMVSRFAVDPRWLIHVPPTMSPVDPSGEMLENPASGLAYYRGEGVARVICQRKHAGARAVAIVCRDDEVARARFGIAASRCGSLYSRLGRALFDDQHQDAEVALLEHLRKVLTEARIWQRLATNWIVLDAEVMPSSPARQRLFEDVASTIRQPASVTLLDDIANVHRQALARLPDLKLPDWGHRHAAETSTDYMGGSPTRSWIQRNAIRVAPFHILATEGATHFHQPHDWHLRTIESFVTAGDRQLERTPWRIVDVDDERDVGLALDWWAARTADGWEGTVFKPLEFIARGKRGLVQPALKCRSPEYLRYLFADGSAILRNPRLHRRRLAARRALATRQFALGVEGLSRFVAGEPLRRVHECSFGVLALGAEPVDLSL